jgi:hypothetical protein
VLPEFILHLHYVPGLINDKDIKSDDNDMKNIIQNNENNSIKVNNLNFFNSYRKVVINTKKMTLPRSLISNTIGEIREIIPNANTKNDDEICSIGDLFLKNKMRYHDNNNKKIEKNPEVEKQNLSYSRQLELNSHARFLAHKQAIISHIDNVVDEFNYRKIKMLKTAYLNLDIASK